MSKNTLWVEEHRPSTFDEIAGNDAIISEISQEVESGNMNHMAFFGPPGIGKTTTALVIVNEMYGSESNQYFKELNASDERGIDTIRNKVKQFAGKKTLTGKHKIIFLDEADSLTPDAQQALRRVMEKYQETCRFILSGNDEGGLIPAIKSRCSVHNFRPVDDESAKERLLQIVEEEDVDVDEETVDKIVTINSGDVRSMVSKLQSVALSDDDVEIDAGEDYLRVLKFIKEKNFTAAKRAATDQNLSQMYRYIQSNDDFPNQMKADVSIVMAKYQWRMDRSPDRDIQQNALVAELIRKIQQYA